MKRLFRLNCSGRLFNLTMNLCAPFVDVDELWENKKRLFEQTLNVCLSFEFFFYVIDISFSLTEFRLFIIPSVFFVVDGKTNDSSPNWTDCKHLLSREGNRLSFFYCFFSKKCSSNHWHRHSICFKSLKISSLMRKIHSWISSYWMSILSHFLILFREKIRRH